MRKDNVLRALARGCTACAVLGMAAAAQAQLNEDWSSGTENGWTATSDFGLSNWVFDPGLGEWFGADFDPAGAGPESQYLTSPTFTMGADLGLEVEHWFDLEDTFDGGVLEISVNGGPFTYVPGGAILAGQPYTATISSNFQSQIGGQQAFSNVSDSGAGFFVTSSFYLGGFAAPGDMVQVRFRLATDTSVADDGWYITRVTSVPLVDPSGACCLAGVCSESSQSACGISGGVFQGAGSTCAGVVCPAEGSDSCASATTISSLPFEFFGNNAAATADGPMLTCNGGHTTIHNSVWWTLEGTGQPIRLNADGLNFDEVIAVLEGPDCDNLIQLFCSDPGNTNFDFVAESGQTYRIVIGDWGATAGGGDYRLTVNPGTPPPANDECDASEILAPNSPLAGTTAGATGTSTASCDFNERDVWYALLPLPNTDYRVFTTNAGANMSLAVFQQECPPAGSEIACGDPSSTDASVDFTSDALGSAIFIRAASDQAAETTFDITVIELPGACSGTDGLCRQLTPTDCAAAGGAFNGGDCAEGACCTGENCSISTEGACADAGGSYQGDGTDCGVYSADDTLALAFEDISATGTLISLGDDQLSAAQPIGFSFEFFGNTYTDAYVSSNGFITFDGGAGSGCCTGQILPNPAAPNDVIAIAWEDFQPALGGSITVQTLGTAPNRRFIVQFTGVPHCCSATNPTITAQVKLFEGTNVIEFHYQDLQQDAFGDMTIGVENADGTEAVQYFHGAELPPLGSTFAVAVARSDSPCATPSCVCETDGDANQVNVFDLLSYLDLWFPSAPAADIDGTSGVNVFDLLFYLDCWFPASAGTPC